MSDDGRLPPDRGDMIQLAVWAASATAAVSLGVWICALIWRMR